LGPHADSQRVVVKIRLVKPRQSAKTSLLEGTQRHLAYLQREGVALDGTAGRVYTRDTTGVAVTGFLHRVAHDPHQFRLIVAPEHGADLDLTAFTRGLMAQVETDLGTTLDWVAVNHHNTDNPHVHVLVRGVDDRGAPLVIARDYIAHGFRSRASALATRELGPRTIADIHQAWEREVTQERFTTIDRWLRHRLEGEALDLGRQTDRPAAPYQHAFMLARLETLQHLGLATPVGPQQWQLTPHWEQTLRDLGARHDIIKTMHQALQRDPRRYHIIDPRDPPPGPIKGRIVAQGLADEWSEREYVIVLTRAGHAYYVSVSGEVAQRLGGVGTAVGVTVAPVRDLESPATRNLAAYTRTTQGIYDPTQHEAWARAHLRLSAEREYTTYVTAHVRRLERLETLGLVERVAPQQWRVPDDLLTRVAQMPAHHKQASAPQVRIERLPQPGLAQDHAVERHR
jgi:type IV secretory pathway VirD2 relaxase